MSIADYSPARERAPVRLGHAAGARALRRGRGARRRSRRPACRPSRRTSAASSSASSTGSTSSGRPSRRRASRPRAARSSASARPTSRRSSPRLAAERIVTSHARREPAGRVPPLQRRGRRRPAARRARPPPRAPRLTTLVLDAAHGFRPRRASPTAITRTRSRTCTSRRREGGPWPCVALIHGGFWRTGWDRTLMTPLAVDLARHGIAAWNLEYRRVGQEGGGWPGTLADVGRRRSIGSPRSTTSMRRASRRAATRPAGTSRSGSRRATGSRPARPAPARAYGPSRPSRRQACSTSTAATRRASAMARSRRCSARPTRTRSATPPPRPRRSRPSASTSSSSTAPRTTSCPSRRAGSTPRSTRGPSSPRSHGGDHFDVIDAGHPAWRDTVAWLSRRLRRALDALSQNTLYSNHAIEARAGRDARRAPPETTRARGRGMAVRVDRRPGRRAPARAGPLAEPARRARRHHAVGHRPPRAGRSAAADRHAAAHRSGAPVRAPRGAPPSRARRTDRCRRSPSD